MTVTNEQRQLVREIAGDCCEYCRIAPGERLSKFQIDHIIALKHGGSDNTDNLSLACLECNSFKGPNVAALDSMTGEATKLYNPRRQKWDEHFRLNTDATITGLTPEGRATVDVLRLNAHGRVQYRQGLTELGIYPC